MSFRPEPERQRRRSGGIPTVCVHLLATWRHTPSFETIASKTMALSLLEFVERWKASTLSERQGAQSHFFDLCEVLGQQHPAAEDQTVRNLHLPSRTYPG